MDQNDRTALEKEGWGHRKNKREEGKQAQGSRFMYYKLFPRSVYFQQNFTLSFLSYVFFFVKPKNYVVY